MSFLHEIPGTACMRRLYQSSARLTTLHISRVRQLAPLPGAKAPHDSSAAIQKARGVCFCCFRIVRATGCFLYGSVGDSPSVQKRNSGCSHPQSSGEKHWRRNKQPVDLKFSRGEVVEGRAVLPSTSLCEGAGDFLLLGGLSERCDSHIWLTSHEFLMITEVLLLILRIICNNTYYWESASESVQCVKAK